MDEEEDGSVSLNSDQIQDRRQLFHTRQQSENTQKGISRLKAYGFSSSAEGSNTHGANITATPAFTNAYSDVGNRVPRNIVARNNTAPNSKVREF
ncbi:hypothetical protein EMCG_05413 [[Emmonsia] crescens]|uniref:Uncharacterized protein n=1 Tax=[Emmonsia] crescens TaxID=73230 RepID=A0A0G2IXK8_9EURO|nr:hypothetical protein EMCG_05413 [Emmonsia crescens UAMH 3008]